MRREKWEKMQSMQMYLDCRDVALNVFRETREQGAGSREYDFTPYYRSTAVHQSITEIEVAIADFAGCVSTSGCWWRN